MLFFAVQLLCLFTRIPIILQRRKKVTNPEFMTFNNNVQSRDCSRYKRHTVWPVDWSWQRFNLATTGKQFSSFGDLIADRRRSHLQRGRFLVNTLPLENSFPHATSIPGNNPYGLSANLSRAPLKRSASVLLPINAQQLQVLLCIPLKNSNIRPV